MEIVIAAILVIIAIVLIARARDDSGSNPPQPSQTPASVSPTPTPHVDSSFGSFSLFERPSSQVYETSIQFLSDGSVVANYIINGERKEDSFRAWGLQEFSSTPSFEISDVVGVNFDGPLAGLMDESPKWSISVAPKIGLTRSSFILKIYDGSITRKYSILLATEVPDLRF